METLYYVLGVLSALIIIGVAGMFSVAKKANAAAEETQSLWDGIDDLNNDIGKNIDHIERHIDKVQDEFDHRMDSIDKNLHGEIEEIYRVMDSRLDKLEQRLTKIFEDGCKPVQKK